MEHDESDETQLVGRLKSAFRDEALDAEAEPDIARITRRARKETEIRNLVSFAFSRLLQTFLIIFGHLHVTHSGERRDDQAKISDSQIKSSKG